MSRLNLPSIDGDMNGSEKTKGVNDSSIQVSEKN
jgi:hypothetical protein